MQHKTRQFVLKYKPLISNSEVVYEREQNEADQRERGSRLSLARISG